MKKYLKIFWYNLIWLQAFIVSANFARAGLLEGQTKTDVNKMAGDLAGASGFDKNADLSKVVVIVINAFLALLGIIFVVLVIIAGYNWMTAAGDEEKVRRAKETLRRAIIGLIITIGAYSITYFVLSHLPGSAAKPGTFAS